MKISYYNTNHFSKDEQSLKELLSGFYKRLKEEALPFSQLDFVNELIFSLGELEPFLKRFNHLFLLGVGGSALGPQALQQSFAPQDRQPFANYSSVGKKQLWVADNVDMHFFCECMNALPPEETLVLVISKSGSTLETMAQYFVCKQWLQEHLPETWHQHFLAITDEHKGLLREEVKQYNYRALSIPEKLGGRFSVFSAVGIIPAAFLGIDYKNFLNGALDARDVFFTDTEKYLEQFEANYKNPWGAHLPQVFKMAYFAYEAMENDFSELIFFNYLPRWASLGSWFRQLWSESLGKNGKGSTPIPALGATDQHSILQLFLDGKKNKACIFINQHNFAQKNASYSVTHPNCLVPKDIPEEWQWIAGKSLSQILEAEAFATKESLYKSNMPLLTMEPMQSDEYSFGKLMWNLGMMTILTAYFLDINPLDQPAVEQGKLIAKQRLSSNLF